MTDITKHPAIEITCRAYCAKGPDGGVLPLRHEFGTARLTHDDGEPAGEVALCFTGWVEVSIGKLGDLSTTYFLRAEDLWNAVNSAINEPPEAQNR